MDGAAGDGDDLGDIDVDLEDLDDDEQPEKHRDKRARSALNGV